MAQFDKDKCRQRNRLAAKRDGVNAAPVQLLRLEEGERWEFARANRLPQSEGDCLAAINALLPSGTDPLTADDVYIHFAEAANTNFISDRYLFLDRSTLKNVARNAGEGVAFMNSHRTGGMSHPSELPFGKTFAGRFEDGDQARSVIGVYMLRGQKPNGEQGPSTDELDAQIRGGVVADVSVGLYGGEAVCDVCGSDVNAMDSRGEWLCPHVPGTNYQMSEAEMRAQKKRGVPDGCASYSLVNARMGEVSAVYDGAVPGAGFRKALSLSKRLDGECLAQCRTAYHALARERDFISVEAGPDLASFEEQLDEALAAVESCIDRAGNYRNISAGRLADVDRLVARWQEARQKFTPEPSVDVQTLRRKAIERRAALNRLLVGSEI